MPHDIVAPAEVLRSGREGDDGFGAMGGIMSTEAFGALLEKEREISTATRVAQASPNDHHESRRRD